MGIGNVQSSSSVTQQDKQLLFHQISPFEYCLKPNSPESMVSEKDIVEFISPPSSSEGFKKYLKLLVQQFVQSKGSMGGFTRRNRGSNLRNEKNRNKNENKNRRSQKRRKEQSSRRR
jgi:hypothetical protein